VLLPTSCFFLVTSDCTISSDHTHTHTHTHTFASFSSRPHSPTTHPLSLLTPTGGHPVRLVTDARRRRAQLRAPRRDPDRRGDPHGHAVPGARGRTDGATGQRRRYAGRGGGGGGGAIEYFLPIIWHIFPRCLYIYKFNGRHAFDFVLLASFTYSSSARPLPLDSLIFDLDGPDTHTPLQSASARVSCSSRTMCARCAACGMTANGLSE
jgi:hypothetical protein